MILVGHGFGGIIIKRFLNTISDNYFDPAYQTLRSVQAGVVFLGTPHPTRVHRDRWLSLSLILRACLKVSGGILAQAELEAATIANISEKFQDLDIEVPVLSVFESKKTHIGDNLFKSRKQLLVDKLLAQTFVDSEVLIQANEDHHKVCSIVKGSEIYIRLSDLLDTAMSHTMEPNAESSGNAFNEPDFTWASTMSEKHGSPADATGGSSNVNKDDLVEAEFVELRVPVRLPCYMLKAHSRNREFIGRKKILGILDEALLPPENLSQSQTSGIRSFALCGLGGMGKTQTALEFAYSRKGKFDAVFWVQADEGVKLDESFSQIAVELPLISTAEAKDRVVSRNAVLAWLCEPYKNSMNAAETKESDEIPEFANWLLILDNVEDFSLLRDYVPLDGNGSILITSRNPIAQHYLSSNAGIDLEPLDLEEADLFVQCLTYRSITDEDRKGSSDLTKRLGGLPIAITHVAGIMNSKDLTFAECLKAYEEEAVINATNELNLAQTAGYEHKLTTVWALENLSGTALRLLQVLSLLDPDIVSETILLHSEGHELCAEFPPLSEFVDVRTELIKASLVKRNRQEKTLAMHRVVQDVVRAKMSAERLKDIFTLAVTLLGLTWVEDREWAFGFRTSEWRIADSMNPHIMGLQTLYERHHPDLEVGSLRDFASLVSRAGTHLLERANFDASLQLAKLALEISRTHEEDMGELYADVLMSLCMAYASCGDREQSLHFAKLHFDQRLAVEARIGMTADSEMSLQGMAYTALALGLLLNERFEEAIPLCLKGKELHERSPGFLTDVYWPHWAYAYHAWALIGLNREKEALPLILKTLEWRERHYGPNDTESLKTANALQILGIVRERQGLLDEAFNAFKRSLPLYAQTDGDSSFRTNQVRIKLGEHYSRLQQPEVARIMFDTALKYYQEQSFYRPETTRTLFKKSQFLKSFGDEEGAAEVMAEAEKIYFELRPKEWTKRGDLTAEDFDRIVMIFSR